MVTGVSDGFEKKLDLIGVGYRAAMAGKELTLNLGYSHPVVMPLPAGLSVAVDRQTSVTVTAIDKQARPAASAALWRRTVPRHALSPSNLPPGARRLLRRRPRHAAAGALQGQGYPLQRRGGQAEGGQIGQEVDAACAHVIRFSL